MSRLLLFPQPVRPPLSEADIVTDDLLINLQVLKTIALRKAEQWPPEERDFAYRHELHALRLLAEAMIENRKAQRAAEQGSPKERVIRALELEIYKTRYGMSMPFDAERVRHLESLLAEAKAAAPDDPGVLLAEKLIAAE